MQLDEDLHEDLSVVMEENDQMMTDKYPPDSFLGIFWRQQRHAASLKNARSMKWEAAMIRYVAGAVMPMVGIVSLYLIHVDTCIYLFRWCLYLRHLSSSAYELLHNSGVLKLPSQRTLRDYTYYHRSSNRLLLEC